MQIPEDWRVPFFADHNRALTERFKSKLADESRSSAARQISTLTECLFWFPEGSEGRMVLANMLWLPVRRWSCRHSESCPTGAFWLPWLRFSVLFSSVVKWMPWCNMLRMGTSRTLPRYVGFLWVPEFHLDSRLIHDQSGCKSQKAFQPELCPLLKACYLLSSGPHFVHIEVFSHNRKPCSLSVIPLVVKVSVIEPSDAVKRRNV